MDVNLYNKALEFMKNKHALEAAVPTGPSNLYVIERVDSEGNVTLQKKLQNESFFYKFILWLRALFDKKTVEQLYGQDLLNGLARKINSR